MQSLAVLGDATTSYVTFVFPVAWQERLATIVACFVCPQISGSGQGPSVLSCSILRRRGCTYYGASAQSVVLVPRAGEGRVGDQPVPVPDRSWSPTRPERT